MCGFTGIFERTLETGADDLTVAVRAMAATLHHRGPDDGAEWVDATAGIALGHRRLSIVDLSSCGEQPMASASGRYVVAYNGEIYNFLELRAELEGRGCKFRGHSDTEILLAAVEEWGVEAANRRFVGMFAYALWDRADQKLVLARDRLGEKPLYYGWCGDVLLFGSELKALRAHPKWRGEVDRDTLALYLRYGYVPAPYSIYRGISKLPPGTFLTIGRDASARADAPVAYWSMADIVRRGQADRFDGSLGEAVDELERLLGDAVRQQMVADVPLGAFLSGGIDSSTIVALMQAQSSVPVQSFSIGFESADYNEAEYARAVAAHLGTSHTEHYVTAAEAMAVVPKIPSLYDEPFADSSQIPTHLVSAIARQKVTVSLSGDGGDELFGGYNRHFIGPSVWNRIRHIPWPIRATAAAALKQLSPRRVDAWNQYLPGRIRQPQLGGRLQKLVDVLGVPDADAIYLRLVSEWRNPASIVLGSREPATLLTDRSGWPEISDFSERMMFLDSMTYLPDDILVKVDRAAMATSLETRVPFLDHRVVEFAWRLPIEMKIRNGKGKLVLRHLLDRHVPRHLIERPKMGFGVPLNEWLRGPLREWAEELLDERRLRAEGFFDPVPIRMRWKEHLSGQRDWHFSLWFVLMFQAWLERLREPAATEVDVVSVAAAQR